MKTKKGLFALGMGCLLAVGIFFCAKGIGVLEYWSNNTLQVTESDSICMVSASSDVSSDASVEDIAEQVSSFVVLVSGTEADDADDFSNLDMLAEEIETAYASLTDEEKESISETMEAYENAVTSLETIEQAAAGKTVETTAENSYRYINGQPVYDAISSIEEEISEISDETDTSEDSSEEAETSGVQVSTLSLTSSSASALSQVLNSDSEADVITVSYQSDSPSYSGVDVSYWQGTIDWASAAEDVDFVILRVSHGGTADTNFATNAAACETYGIPYGVYVYTTATSVAGATEDATLALSLLSGYAPDLPVFWDIEDKTVFATVSTSTLSKMANAFCSTITSGGYSAGVYSSAYYWYTYLDTFAQSDSTYTHWVAQYASYCAYGDESAVTAYNKSWATYQSYHRYELWQFTSEAKYSWTESTYTDRDYWYGDLNLTTLTKAKNSTSGVTLTWTGATSANKYVIYRKTGDGSYEKIATTTDTTYTDTSAKSGKTYTYKIRVVTGNGTKSTSNTKTVTYLKAPKISKVKNTSSGVKITWKKVSGASGYYVYRKTGNGSWKKIKTITSGSKVTYTDSTAKNGKTYTYTIVSYNSDGKSAKRSGSTITRLKTACVSSVKNSASKAIKVTWKKNSKATGYQICYSTSSSFKNSKTVTVSSKSTLSTTLKSLKKGKTYYIRIRSYKTVDGKKYYSEWSSTKSVKVKK